MKVWIEQCEQSGHGVSWEGVASLVKATQCNGDRNLIEREINLAYGLKDTLVENEKLMTKKMTKIRL